MRGNNGAYKDNNMTFFEEKKAETFQKYSIFDEYLKYLTARQVNELQSYKSLATNNEQILGSLMFDTLLGRFNSLLILTPHFPKINCNIIL